MKMSYIEKSGVEYVEWSGEEWRGVAWSGM
jgi:hypothetical protein